MKWVNLISIDNDRIKLCEEEKKSDWKNEFDHD
jgi:hypothetical protein